MRAALVTTVHDLSHIVCPAYQTHANNESLREGLEFARRAGSRYVAVSESTASQMVELLGVDRTAIDVISEGVDRRRFSPAVDEPTRRRVAQRSGLPSGPFLLCLVIAGACGWGAHSELDREIAACPRARRVGYVDEDDLPTLYALCRAFCYVSHYEGFGLPVAEAMSCGAPVIYGNSSSLPEVAGEGGMGAAPEDVESIATAMRRLLVDDAFRASLAVRAVARARQYDWDEAARKTLHAYQAGLAAVSRRDRRNAERPCVKAA
jgi:glycosyltransferase involved in cell wall biosynthesis